MWRSYELYHIYLAKDLSHFLLFQTLKEKLIAKFPGQVFKYDCQVGGIDNSTGRERVLCYVLLCVT